MNVPHIIEKGPAWFSSMGTTMSKGTKVFCVSGDVKNPGVYELEMGTTIAELLFIAGAEDTRFVQVGGAAGVIRPASEADMPLSHETCLGSGAVMVFNSSRDVIDIIHSDMRFLNEESCGKCTPCREGTEVMMEIYERLGRGEAMAGDIEVLEDLARTMALASLCGLGQAAAVPVLDSLKYFREDYLVRVDQSVFLRSYISELAESKEGVR
jgi:NADH:ubiquinone oxidoreductase subunit F (NADH-binding)